MTLRRSLARLLHGLGGALVMLGDAFAGTEEPLTEPDTWPGDYLAEEIEKEET